MAALLSLLEYLLTKENRILFAFLINLLRRPDVERARDIPELHECLNSLEGVCYLPLETFRPSIFSRKDCLRGVASF